MEHLVDLGLGIAALAVAALLLVAAERRARRSSGSGPADMGLD